MENQLYKMMIANLARHIASDINKEKVAKGDPSALDAFKASDVLAVATCKLRVDIVSDIVNYKEGK